MGRLKLARFPSPLEVDRFISEVKIMVIIDNELVSVPSRGR